MKYEVLLVPALALLSLSGRRISDKGRKRISDKGRKGTSRSFACFLNRKKEEAMKSE